MVITYLKGWFWLDHILWLSGLCIKEQLTWKKVALDGQVF